MPREIEIRALNVFFVNRSGYEHVHFVGSDVFDGGLQRFEGILTPVFRKLSEVHKCIVTPCVYNVDLVGVDLIRGLAFFK